MASYIVRRLLLIIPTVVLVTIVCFAIVRLIPGTVIELMVADMGVAAGRQDLTAEILRRDLGLDLPVTEQYVRWVSRAIQGDLGKSLWSGTPVAESILARLPVTIELGLIAVILGVLIGVPIGVMSAIRQDTALDYIGRSISILAISVPMFVIGTVLIVYPAIWWGWMPQIGYIRFSEDPVGNLKQFLVPAAVLGLDMSGVVMRMTRTMMLEVLRQDYVRTAWAKGLRERSVIIEHALKNALSPVVTIVGIQLVKIVSGSVVLEQIFGLPGIGRLLLSALNSRDYPLLSGINLTICMFIVFANLVVDVSYTWLNPKVRSSI